MIPPTRYTSSLRDRQKQATQDQIMHAVARKLESGPLEDLSFAEIAAEAEVGERTVYRLRVSAGTAANAANLCGKLRVAGENCVVVR